MIGRRSSSTRLTEEPTWWPATKTCPGCGPWLAPVDSSMFAAMIAIRTAAEVPGTEYVPGLHGRGRYLLQPVFGFKTEDRPMLLGEVHSYEEPRSPSNASCRHYSTHLMRHDVCCRWQSSNGHHSYLGVELNPSAPVFSRPRWQTLYIQTTCLSL